jgi:DNA-binding transcriptional LysR family regulator
MDFATRIRFGAYRKAIERGHGISILPAYLCQEALQTGRIQLLWEPPKPVTNEIWLAYRKVERNHARIKELRKLLLSQ